MIKIFEKTLVLAVIFVFVVSIQALASNAPQFSQTISTGSRSVDIIDSSTEASVASPSVTFGALNYSFGTQNSNGRLPSSANTIRVYNPTSSTAVFTVSIGATGASTWSDGGSNTYAINDAIGATGQMTIDPSTNGSIAGVNGCSAVNISKGSSASFAAAKSSIDIITSATSVPAWCRWEYTSTGNNVVQTIPAGQATGTYTIGMTLTMT